MKTTRNNLCIIILLLLFIPFLDACDRDKGKESSANNTPVADLMASMNIQHITTPPRAPDFELFSVTGEKVSLSRHRGKVVLLSFWTTW